MKKMITIGDKFGFWEVIQIENARYLICKCTGCCQTIRKIRKWTLTRGESKSCGCQLKNLMKQTNQEKYGVDYPQQSEEIKSKSKKTLEERYGVDNAMKSKEIAERSKFKKRKNRARKHGGMIFGVTKYNEKV